MLLCTLQTSFQKKVILRSCTAKNYFSVIMRSTWSYDLLSVCECVKNPVAQFFSLNELL